MYAGSLVLCGEMTTQLLQVIRRWLRGDALLSTEGAALDGSPPDRLESTFTTLPYLPEKQEKPSSMVDALFNRSS